MKTAAALALHFQWCQASIVSAPLPSRRRALASPSRSAHQHPRSQLINLLLFEQCDTMAPRRTETKGFGHATVHSLVTQRDVRPSDPWSLDVFQATQHGNARQEDSPALVHTTEAHRGLEQSSTKLLPLTHKPHRQPHLAPNQRNFWIREDVQELGSNMPSTHHLSGPRTSLSRSGAEDGSFSQWHHFKTLRTGEDTQPQHKTQPRKRHISPSTFLSQPPIFEHSLASSQSMDSLVNEGSQTYGKDKRRRRHEIPLTQPELYDHRQTSSRTKNLEVAKDFRASATESINSARPPSAPQTPPSLSQPNSPSRGGDAGQLGLKNLWLPEDFQLSPAASSRGASEDKPSTALSNFPAGFRKPNASKWEAFLEDCEMPGSSSMRFSDPHTPSPNFWRRDWSGDKAAATGKQSFSASKILDNKISSPFTYKTWSHSDSETRSRVPQNLREDEVTKESSLLRESRMLLLHPFITTQSLLSQHAAG